MQQRTDLLTSFSRLVPRQDKLLNASKYVELGLVSHTRLLFHKPWSKPSWLIHDARICLSVFKSYFSQHQNILVLAPTKDNTKALAIADSIKLK